MVKRDRRRAVAVLALAAVAAAAWMALHRRASAPAPDAQAAGGPRTAAGRGEAEVPLIDLARLDRPRPESGIGRRDIFDFGAPPATPPPPVVEAPPPAVSPATPPPVAAAPAPPPVPPLNVKYVGAFEGRHGLKVAVLMTDRREVLTGQAGEVVANRLRIVRIGLESVDVQDVGSDQVRRIPLKGN